MKKETKLASAKTAFVFGGVTWLYVIAMQMIRPESVNWTVVYWTPITMDFFGEIAFIVSLIGFFIWQRYK